MQGEPSGDRLHPVTLDVLAIPHGKRNRNRHAELELHVIGVLGLQRPLVHHTPRRTRAAPTLARTRMLPHTVPQHIPVDLGRQGAEPVRTHAFDGPNPQPTPGARTAPRDPGVARPRTPPDP